MDFSSIDLIKLIYLFVLLTIVQTQEPCVTPSFENGVCVHYRDCPFVEELNRRFGVQLPQYLKEYIFNSKCSKDNEPIRLCCKVQNYTPKPVPESMGSRFNVDLDTTRDIMSQLNTAGVDILNDLNCGKTDGNRVAGGNETDLAEFPWMALLRYDVPGGNQYLCGGSLITNRFVLTASHCVDRPGLPVIGIRLGEHDLSTPEDCKLKGGKRVCNPPVEDFGIEKIISHPDYNKRKRANDIALIKLDRTVEFQRHIQPICLPITQDALQMKTDDDFFIAGWGSTEEGVSSTVLLKARVAHQERSICQKAFTLEINQKHLCAGDLVSGRDNCKGDSGGPLLLFAKYERFKRFIQYGVVASGGVACNLMQRLPGIYTNILNFLPWITDNIVV